MSNADGSRATRGEQLLLAEAVYKDEASSLPFPPSIQDLASRHPSRLPFGSRYSAWTGPGRDADRTTNREEMPGSETGFA